MYFRKPKTKGGKGTGLNCPLYMKIIVSKNEFVGALRSVSRAVSAKSPLPILSGLKICADEKITITGTDLEIGISCTVEADVKEPGTLILPSKCIVDFVEKLPSGPVIIQSEGDNAVIKYGTSEAKINGYPSTEYPEPPNVTPKASFCLTGDALRDTLLRVVYAAASESPRPIMKGVLFEVNFGELTLVATDAYRLAVAHTELESTSGDTSVIVPKRATEEILKLLKGKVTVKIDDQVIEFTSDNLTLTSRLISGAFPDYNKVVPAETIAKISVDAKAIKDTVDRVSLLCGNTSTPVINIKTDGEKLVVTGKSESGKVREDVNLIAIGDMEVNLNAKFLNEAVKSCLSKEVVFEYADALKPVIVKPADRGDIAIILPVRVAS